MDVLSQHKERSTDHTPLIMRFSTVEDRVEAFNAPNFEYDPKTQMTYDRDIKCGGRSTGCTKATYSTPRVGKDPEGDYAADD